MDRDTLAAVTYLVLGLLGYALGFVPYALSLDGRVATTATLVTAPELETYRLPTGHVAEGWFAVVQYDTAQGGRLASTSVGKDDRPGEAIDILHRPDGSDPIPDTGRVGPVLYGMGGVVVGLLAAGRLDPWIRGRRSTDPPDDIFAEPGESD